MFRVYSGTTADEVWLKIASAFSECGTARSRSSRGGPTRDLGHVAITILDPRQRWVVSRKPALNPAFAIAEVVWILNGRDDAEFLNFFNRQLPNYAGKGVKYDGAYGWRLRKHRGIDQLDRAYRALRNCQTSRQVVLQIWDACADLPTEDGAPASPDVPCNIVSLLKVRDGALEWTQILRSNDVFRGLPHNFVQFTTLQEVMAGWLGVELGSFHLVTDSLHLYKTDAKVVNDTTRRVCSHNTDWLSLRKEESEAAFLTLARAVDCIVDPCRSPQQVLDLDATKGLSKPFRNLLMILIAEGLRRRRRCACADRIVESCSNPLLRQLWENWQARLSRPLETIAGDK